MKTVRVWLCDGCDNASPWGPGWRYFPGVESLKNKASEGKILPLACCSDACSERALTLSCESNAPRRL